MFKRLAIILAIVAVAAPLCIFGMYEAMSRCEDYGWRLVKQADRLSSKAPSQKNAEKAVRKYQWAATMFRLGYCRRPRCGVLFRLGFVQEQQGNQAEAAECFKKSLHLAKTFGYLEEESRCLAGLGRLYWEKGQYLPASAGF